MRLLSCLLQAHFSPRKSATVLTRALIGLSASCFLAGNADAAGLEKLRVLSSLGQPLRAEIDVTAEAAESGNLSVRLAPASAYAQANVEYGAVLPSLRFVLERRSNGQAYVRVTSNQPINEPYIDMLVELNWSSGRLVREYTFLLDPPELKQPTSLPVPAPVQAPVQRAPAPVAREPRVSTSSATPSSTTSSTAADGTYRVMPGDTLSKIARDNKPDGASLDQMLVALFQNNENAFAAQNINRLKAGAVIRIPDAATAQAVSASDAKRFLTAQTSDFSTYRGNLAQSVTQAPPAAAVNEPKKEASGKVGAKIEEKTAPAATQDQVKLSKLDKSKQDAAVASATSAATSKAAEDIAAKERGLQEANTRVGLLEKNVADLEKLIQLKNQNLSDLQKQLETKSAPAAPPPAPVAAVPAAPAPQPTATAPVEAPNPATKVEAKPAPKAAPAVVPAAAPAPASSSYFDDLLGSSTILYGLGALVLSLLGFIGYRMSNKAKVGGKFEDSFLGSNSGLRANSIFGQTGGQSVDTSNSTFNSNFLPPVGQPAEHNEVDAIAEAEVYIAYGRDAQAEEILKEALRTQPERFAIHLKLLEIYAKRADVKNFEIVANELYAATNGQGADWHEAAKMGHAVDPGNPLYTDATDAVAETVIPPTTFNPIKTESEPKPAPLFMGAPTIPAAAASLGAMELGRETFANSRALEPVLDMDLTKTEPMTHAPEPDPITADSRVDLDFNFNDPVPATENKVTPPAPTAAAAAHSADDWALRSNVDFSFDLTEGVVTDILSKDESKQERPSMLAAPMDSLLATVHTGHPPGAVPAPNVGAVDLDLSGATNVMGSSMTELESSSFSTDSTLFLGGQHKMTEISLDLDEAPGIAESSPKAAEVSASPDSWQEMATKLDLATAYRDIGDKDGARELLDEVIKGGDVTQSDKAKELLASLH